MHAEVSLPRGAEPLEPRLDEWFPSIVHRLPLHVDEPAGRERGEVLILRGEVRARHGSRELGFILVREWSAGEIVLDVDGGARFEVLRQSGPEKVSLRHVQDGEHREEVIEGRARDVVAILAGGRAVDVDARDKYGAGSTALLQAAYFGHGETVDALLEAGADPTLRDVDGKSPADWAAHEGHADLAETLERAVEARAGDPR